MNNHQISRDPLIELLNGILKDTFEYVPLEKVINVADRLIEAHVTLPLVIKRAKSILLELKPCPFCGGEARLYKTETESLIDNKMLDAYYVMCDSVFCGCLTQYHESAEDAENAWNSRVRGEEEDHAKV